MEANATEADPLLKKGKEKTPSQGKEKPK